MDQQLPPHIAEAFRRAPGELLTTGQLGRLGVPRPHLLALIDEDLVERMLYGVMRDPSAVAPWDQPLHLPLVYLGQRRPATARRRSSRERGCWPPGRYPASHPPAP
jgi:hypothetical protein